jgi:hypothetical protein
MKTTYTVTAKSLDYKNLTVSFGELSCLAAKTVAEMLGYKSYPTFIRNYKTYLNTNPSNDKP